MTTEAELRSVADERRRILESQHQGTRCECCGHFVKVYPRSLDSSQARALLLLAGAVRARGDDPLLPFDAVEILRRNRSRDRDLGMLAARGLLRVVAGKKGQRRVYAFTPKGLDFVCGRARIMSQALVLRGKVIGFRGNDVSILEALGESFSYDAVMAEVQP